MSLQPRTALRVLAALLPASLLLSLAGTGLDGATAATARPDLVVPAVSLGDVRAAPGGAVSVTTAVRNTGRARARHSTVRVYLSQDATRDPFDPVLLSARTPSLRAHRTSRATHRATVPKTIPPGRYRVLACTDARGKVRESRERNNCRAATAALTVTAPEAGSTGGGPNQAGYDRLLAAGGPLQVLTSPVESGRTIGATVDEGAAVTRTIGPDGGQLVVEDSQGDTLTLDVPAGALLGRVAITATPVTSTDGEAATGGRVMGLRLEPEGLAFTSTATLSVVPAGGDAARQAEGMISRSDGSASRPADVLPDPDHLILPVDHFTLIRILVADGAGGLSSHLFTDGEYLADIRSRTTQALLQARNDLLAGLQVDLAARLLPILDEEYTNLLVPIMDQSATDCGFFRTHFSYVTGYRGELIKLGLVDPVRDAVMTKAWVAGLRNCWEKQTAACLSMDPARFVAIVSTAKEFTDLGLDLADGSTPDPSALSWCGDVNGFVELTGERHEGTAGSGSQTVDRNHTLLWVSLKTYALSWSHFAPTYDIATTDIGKNAVDVTYHYRWDQQYLGDLDQPCTHTETADAAFSRVPVPYLVHMRVRTANDTFFDGGSLKPGGDPGTWPILTAPVSVSDSCGDQTPYDAYFNWTDTPGTYDIRVDRAKGDILADGTALFDNGQASNEVTIHANVHVDGLHDFLVKGP